jgi:hypothetical protein
MPKMKTHKFWILAISAIACPSYGSKLPVTGFECIASDGTIRFLNIDLKKQRYSEGLGFQKLDRVTDTVIILKAPNPDLLFGPMGPVIASLELDRRTLLLTEKLAMPDRKINRMSQFQCKVRDPIDFTAGRKF